MTYQYKLGEDLTLILKKNISIQLASLKMDVILFSKHESEMERAFHSDRAFQEENQSLFKFDNRYISTGK